MLEAMRGSRRSSASARLDFVPVGWLLSDRAFEPPTLALLVRGELALTDVHVRRLDGPVAQAVAEAQAEVSRGAAPLAARVVPLEAGEQLLVVAADPESAGGGAVGSLVAGATGTVRRGGDELGYWRRSLAEVEPVELPSAHPWSPAGRFGAESRRVVLPSGLAAAVEALGPGTDVVLLAAWQAVLVRWAAQERLWVGVPTPDASIVLVDGDLSGDPTFAELVERVRDARDAALAHAVPYAELLAALRVERPELHDPFQIGFAFRPSMLPAEGEAYGPFVVAPVAAPRAMRGELELHLWLEEGKLAGRCLYGRERFDVASVDRLLASFATFLAAAVERPESRCSELPLMTDVERRRVVEAWADAAVPYPDQASIAELFERQAAATPDAVAVETEGDSLTYRELDERADRLANKLAAAGVGPDVLVAIGAGRSAAMIVGLVAILKAGGAYLPLDLDYPAERIAFMLEDARPRVVLAASGERSSLPLPPDAVVIDLEAGERAEQAGPPGPAVRPDNLAYVTYTSGSTGRPKGVAVTQAGVVRLVSSPNFVRLDPSHTMLQFAPITFDASTLEIWGALLNGMRLVVAPPGALSLAELGELIERTGVTTLWLTAPLFHLLVEQRQASLRGVRQLLAGGDVLSPAHVREALAVDERLAVVNGYGPTETTTFACCHPMRGTIDDSQPVPIGRPISNTRVYVLDRHLRPVPAGVRGELYVGGPGVARGYLDRPGLTAERFVPDPVGPVPGERLYRTGDVARHRPDGTIEFLGRADRQVKVRGFRVELGEIEVALCAHEAVRDAVVVARDRDGSEKALVAYVVAEPQTSSGELRAFLRRRLPDYLVPQAVVALEGLPLDANGKVDRNALPEPGWDVDAEAGENGAAPEAGLEETIAAVWRQVLKLDAVGVDDNFFDLGGDSLLLALVHEELEPVVPRKLRLIDLFRYPTIAELARYCAGDGDAAAAGASGARREARLATARRRQGA